MITTTFNRSELLNTLYQSLCEQTDKNFDWVIIDDGSTDNTKKVVSQWIDENKVNIKYYYEQNHGKHCALNYAFDLVQSEFCINVDSDDYLDLDAIKILNENAQLMSDDVWAIVGPRVHSNGQLEKEWLVKDFEKIKFAQLYNKFGYRGETYILFKTKCVKNIKFPIYDNERLVPENYLYDKLDKALYVLTFSKRICISDYKADGYTKNSNKVLCRSPKGVALSNLSYSSNSYNWFIKRCISYARFKSITKIFGIDKKCFEKYKIWLSCRFFGNLAYPLVYFRYKKKLKNEKID